jgi:hypothetical protein
MTATLVTLGVLAGASPALSATTNGTTWYVRTVDRWQTLCDDGAWVISRYNTILDYWDTTITARSPRQACIGQMNPCKQQAEARSRQW